MTKIKLLLLFVVFIILSQLNYSPDDTLINVDFDNNDDGNYTPANLENDWGNYEDIISLVRTNIISDSSQNGNKYLEVLYPLDSIGSRACGASFTVAIEPKEEYWLGYKLKFKDGFSFRLGGKLPGLTSGGEKYTGGNLPKNGEGWSARYMWRKEGEAVVYLYYIDMPGIWGQDLPLNVSFIPERWHKITQHIILNRDNEKNGTLEVWFDGKKVLEKNDLRFRTENKGLIDAFYFSTFHGGNQSNWAPEVDSYIFYDDFIIDTKPDYLVKKGYIVKDQP